MFLLYISFFVHNYYTLIQILKFISVVFLFLNQESIRSLSEILNCSWLKLQVTRSTQVSFSNDNNCWLVGRSVDGNSGTGILALHRCIFWHIGTFIGQHYGSCSFLTFMVVSSRAYKLLTYVPLK